MVGFYCLGREELLRQSPKLDFNALFANYRTCSQCWRYHLEDVVSASPAQLRQGIRQLPPHPVDSEVHDRWRFVIQLCSVYGLRPEELRYLVIKDGVSGAELWTTDRKSMGGTKGAKTEPACSPVARDPDGTAIVGTSRHGYRRVSNCQRWTVMVMVMVMVMVNALNQHLRRRKVSCWHHWMTPSKVGS